MILWFISRPVSSCCWPLGSAEDRALAQKVAQHIQVDGNMQTVRIAASNSEVLHQL